MLLWAKIEYWITFNIRKDLTVCCLCISTVHVISSGSLRLLYVQFYKWDLRFGTGVDEGVMMTGDLCFMLWSNWDIHWSLDETFLAFAVGLFEHWIIVSLEKNNHIHQRNSDNNSLGFVYITSKSVTLWFMHGDVFYLYFTYSGLEWNLYLLSVWFVMSLLVLNLWMDLLSVRLGYSQTGQDCGQYLFLSVSVWDLYNVNINVKITEDQRGKSLLTLYSVIESFLIWHVLMLFSCYTEVT